MGTRGEQRREIPIRDRHFDDLNPLCDPRSNCQQSLTVVPQDQQKRRVATNLNRDEDHGQVPRVEKCDRDPAKERDPVDPFGSAQFN